ncbi:hypothetical protein B0H11DRAFT_2240645 [Mycena galericulata]|nr:hypothetical protein B0H11DRAFT_2240645 [Mycena galericulata]
MHARLLSGDLMPLSEEALGALLNARTAFIEQPDYSIPDFHNVIEAHTAKDSAERTAWLKHIDPLTSAMKEETELPVPPGTTPAALQKRSGKTAGMNVNPMAPMSEMAIRHAQIRAQRQLDLAGAPEKGDVGPARPRLAGRRPDKLADSLIIEEKEPDGKGKDITVVYCIGCLARTPHRNPGRIKDHAIQCESLAKRFPTLLADVVKSAGARAVITADIGTFKRSPRRCI